MESVEYRLNASPLQQRSPLLVDLSGHRDDFCTESSALRIWEAHRWQARLLGAEQRLDPDKSGSSCTWHIRFLDSRCRARRGVKISTGTMSHGQDH